MSGGPVAGIADGSEEMAGKRGKPGKGKGFKALALASLVLGILVGSGILVYSSDYYYFGDRTNLTLDIPDVLVSGSRAPFIITTEDRDGNPRPDSPVRITLDKGSGPKAVFEGRTDASGFLSANVNIPALPGKAILAVQAGSETVSRLVQIVNASGSPKAKVYLSTDKPVYQPGQTIHIRALCFGGLDFKASTGPVVLQVTDPNEDRIFRKSLSADEYGISSYDLPLSDQLPLGTYIIKAGLSADVFTELPVVVKRYSLPKFQIDLNGLKPWYHMADGSVITTLNVSYTFGKPVNGTAMVTATVKEQPAYKDRWYYRSKPPSGTVLDRTFQLYDGHVSLNIPIQTGNYDYTSRSYENLAYAAYTLVINVTVKDEAGHRETESFEVEVVQTPYRPVILADSFMTGEPARLSIIVIDPDGSPVPGADLGLLYRPNSDNDNNRYTCIADERGVASVVMDYEGPGSVDLTIKGNDTRYYSTYNYRIFGNIRLKVDTEDRSFRPGETASFEVKYHPGGDIPDSGNIYYEVESEGLVLGGGVTRVEGGRGTISFTTSELMAPAAEVRVFRTLPDGDAVQDAVLFTVERPLELAVGISPDTQTTRPGGSVGLDLLVTDPDGELGGPAALGVKIVDQSVYELGQRVVSEDDLFHGMRASSRSARYDIALYVQDPKTPMPSVEGVAYEHAQSPGVSVYSSYSDYMASAKDRKAGMIGSYWTVLAIGGAVFMLSLVSLGGRRRLHGRLSGTRNPNLGVIFAALLIAFTMTAFSFVVMINSRSAVSPVDNGPGTLDLNSQSGGAGAPKAAMAGGFGLFDIVPSSQNSGTTTSPSHTGLIELEKKTSVRNEFPETWYWNPVLITDPSGRAHIDLEAPDTLTTWGVDAAASTKDGRFGVGQANITVFQEFFVEPDLPAYLVRNDTVRLPVLVYNYLGQNRTVDVALQNADWMSISGATSATITVPANSSRSVFFNITALEVGVSNLTVEGRTGIYEDIVTREVNVLPDGRLVTRIFNGELTGSDNATHTIEQNPLRINGSANAYLKVEGSMAGVALDGADSFIQFAYGCGEQSTSVFTVDLAAYRNLQLYGTDPSKLTDVERFILQAIQYEAQFLTRAGGGRAIAWHPGEVPDIWLTAWAVFAYQDAINAGFDIDESILAGLRTYLVSVQGSDGAWDFPEIGHWSINSELLNKKAVSTAYVLRSLEYAGQPMDRNVKQGLNYLADHLSLDENAYGLAVSLLALGSYDFRPDLQDKIAARLVELKKDNAEKGTVFWEAGPTSGAGYYSRGDPGTVEVTAYAALGLAASKEHTGLVMKALSHLLSIRENGVWHNTHSTAVALQALNLEGAFSAKDMTIAVNAGGADAGSMHLTRDNNDLVFYTDLRPFLEADNSTDLSISSSGQGTVVYQLVYEENIPWDAGPGLGTELSLQVRPGSLSIATGNGTSIEVTVQYKGTLGRLKMVLVEIPLPAGFSFDQSELEDLMAAGRVNGFELAGGRLLRFYIDGLVPNAPASFSFHVVAQCAGELTMQGVRAYDMYETERSTTLAPMRFTVS